MAKDSNIDYLKAQHPGELPGATWSPWIGCDQHDEQGQIREGCRHCWAKAWAARTSFAKDCWGRDARRYFFGDEHWRKPVRWNAQCQREGKRMRVMASLCDPWEQLRGGHPQRHQMIETRLRFLELIELTSMLDWLVLTKRPESIPAIVGDMCLPNLWLGTSVWDQPSADRNIPLLLEVPAALHWVSLEPLLGPVEMRAEWLGPENCGKDCHRDSRCRICIHRSGLWWIVVGCESRGARPGRRCELTWVHDIGNACAADGVPMFTKQLPDDERSGRLIKSAELKQHLWPVEMPR